MYLHFPTLDTLRLALTSGGIPEAVRAAPARFGFDDDGALWALPSAELNAKVQKELRRLGVRLFDQGTMFLDHDAAHWLQLLPLARDPRGGALGDKTPVLFELTKPGQLAEIATEMLRLGNDRQSFRWLDDGADGKALLRVVGPPYYSLLRALESDSGENRHVPIAYREVAPHVWVQIGFAHPLAEHLKAPAGQWLLLRAPHQWTAIPDAKLRDIYEVIEFQLPDAVASWNAVERPERMAVNVKLTRSGAPEAAELWVLREAGIAQLEELGRSSDNELLARLAFGVGEKNGERLVVLRVRPSKNAPPVLVLDGLALRSYLRIPNLFVPIGMALHPPLRRDAVIQLLAADKTRLTWLTPLIDGSSFTPESLPDDAFRPLSEWIDYVLEHEHQAMKTWLGETLFQFESFVCKDEVSKEKKPPKEPAGPKLPRRPEPEDVEEPAKEIDVAARKKARKPDTPVETDVSVKPGELEKRLREVEAAYNALTTPLEDAGRQTLWEEMARINGALNQPADAAVCWASTLWEMPRVPPELPREWFRLEAKQAVGVSPPTALIVRILGADPATHGHVRLVTAALVWAAAMPTPPADLRAHLGKVQTFLLKHESFLGVRTIWLAWHALDQLSGGDVLTLARARDRLLERLHLHGLTPELDLPGFLRFTGLQASHRFRMVRDQVVRLRQHVQDWAKLGKFAIPETHAYLDLIFAFGLARLGESIEARNLLRQAGATLAPADEIHNWLFEAFEFRIQQALDGKPALASLSRSLLERLETLEEPKKDSRQIRLKIEQVRSRSRILEPLERLGAYRVWLPPSDDELKRQLDQLEDVQDREELTRRLADLFNGRKKCKGATKNDVRILIAALERAPRLGQAFGEETLDRAPEALAKSKSAETTAQLVEKSLFLAAHCDRKEDVQHFVTQLHRLLADRKALAFEHLIPLVAGSFRGLRKFGLREAALALLHRLGDVVQAEKLVQTRTGTSGVSDKRSKFHCLLLELAAGWFFFGEETRARKILDESRDLLLQGELYCTHQADLACAYLTALGQAPMEFALARMMEFFRKIEGVYDMWTTQSHFSLTRMMVVESMILAIVSDDFTLDPQARKRLDDDEFLVRRRIHGDVRTALAKAGM